MSLGHPQLITNDIKSQRPSKRSAAPEVESSWFKIASRGFSLGTQARHRGQLQALPAPLPKVPSVHAHRVGHYKHFYTGQAVFPVAIFLKISA